MPPNKLWIASFDVRGVAAEPGPAFIFGSQDINAEPVIEAVPATGARQRVAALFAVDPNSPPPQFTISPLNLIAYNLYSFTLVDVFGN